MPIEVGCGEGGEGIKAGRDCPACGGGVPYDGVAWPFARPGPA